MGGESLSAHPGRYGRRSVKAVGGQPLQSIASQDSHASLWAYLARNYPVASPMVGGSATYSCGHALLTTREEIDLWMNASRRRGQA